MNRYIIILTVPLIGLGLTVSFLLQAAVKPIVIDEAKGEVSFKAKLRKPEHPIGYVVSRIAGTPNALVNESAGTSLVGAALVADKGVSAKELTEALQDKLGLEPGQNIRIDERGKTAEGDEVEVYIEGKGKRLALAKLLKDVYPAAKVRWVFLGNYSVQEKMGCGCLVCGRSGPGTVIANSEYASHKSGIIGPTLHAGLKKAGFKEGDKVNVVIAVKKK